MERGDSSHLSSWRTEALEETKNLFSSSMFFRAPFTPGKEKLQSMHLQQFKQRNQHVLKEILDSKHIIIGQVVIEDMPTLRSK